LIHLESQILGLQRSEDDVPGHLIPQIYNDYMRNGDAGALRRVFYHNQEDVLSMVGLAERLGWAFCGSSEQHLEEMLQREDWLALGACYEASDRLAEAETAYRRASEMLRDPQAKAEAFQRLGNLLKRQQRWTEAMELWQYWLTSVPGLDSAPYIELAKCCEWQLRDLEQAEMWTAWALHNLRTAPAWQRPPGALADLEHRQARLRRKQGLAS
jgi:tetratricopeptide (TPR) repeat protein